MEQQQEGDAQAGASTAASGTKNNELSGIKDGFDSVKNKINDLKNQVSADAMNEVNYLLNNGYLDIDNMPSDYVVITLSMGEGIKAASTACIIDKFSNVYGNISFAPGVSIGAPINAGAGWIGTSDKEYTSNAFRGYIEGYSGSIQAMGILGGNIGISTAGVTGEIDLGMNAGLSFSIGETFFIGNIKD